jgi:branched-chain amino acid transport system permease protein
METSLPVSKRLPAEPRLQRYLPVFGLLVVLLLFPFLVAVLSGQPIGDMLQNEAGYSRFYQGLMVEIFILGVYAISFDLLLGITGLLSLGHGMFFAVGAYLTGIMLKSAGWPLLPTLLLVIVAGVLQALLFAVVLPRVKGITFALVTLGIGTVFSIVVQSHELGELTGGDVGLQGIPKPEYLNAATQPLRFYYLALAFTIVVYLLSRLFVQSPTGRVCVAIRENEDRAKMLGYNTFYFKLIALILASTTAALAGALHALFQPIVSPHVAGLGFTVQALLMTLIGGVGTLFGAFVGALVYKLLEFGLDKLVGASASYIIGLIYILLVLFLPYGIVGTWLLRRHEFIAFWRRVRNQVSRQRASEKPGF